MLEENNSENVFIRSRRLLAMVKDGFKPLFFCFVYLNDDLPSFSSPKPSYQPRLGTVKSEVLTQSQCVNNTAHLNDMVCKCS